MLLDGQPTITHNTLLCVHPQKHLRVSSENHDSTSLALSCPVEQQSDKEECNMADKFHLFLIRASSVFLGVPCSSPLPGAYGRISSHLSGCAASAPESSPAPPASSSAAERNKRRSGDYTSVTEWVNEWMNGWMGEAVRGTYLFVFLEDESFRLCVNGSQRQREICLAHLSILLTQTKTQEEKNLRSIITENKSRSLRKQECKR